MTRRFLWPPDQERLVNPVGLVTILAAVSLCAACGSPNATKTHETVPTSYTLRGQLSTGLSRCYEPDRDNGIDGASVTVHNETGEVIGSAVTIPDPQRKAAGDVYGASWLPSASAQYVGFINTNGCIASFSATVPVAKFYRISVGTLDGPSFSFAQMQAQNFSVQLSLK